MEKREVEVMMCPYCENEIRSIDNTCNGCGRNWLTMLSKNKTVAYLQEVNGNMILPIGRIK